MEKMGGGRERDVPPKDVFVAFIMNHDTQCYNHMAAHLLNVF